MLPENNQEFGAGWTPGLAGTLGGWSRPVCPPQEAVWVCVCVCVCCTPVSGLKVKEEEREEGQAQYSFSFFKKKKL